MKTINLYFDFEFTSLSPDAQPISLGIVSDEEYRIKDSFDRVFFRQAFGQEPKKESKSFYAEFSDFDINRCDDWVKENVISKLIGICDPKKVNKHCATNFDIKGKYILYQREKIESDGNYVQYDESPYVNGNFEGIQSALKNWLSKFSDYQIQFISDCGTWDWYWMVQLLAEWEIKKDHSFPREAQLMGDIFLRHETEMIFVRKAGNREILQEHHQSPMITEDNKDGIKSTIFGCTGIFIATKTGLPKLPKNISPVPFDLNDLIAIKKGITPKEAFDLSRVEYLENEGCSFPTWGEMSEGQRGSHNALWDAKVIKEIYQKLK